MPRAAFCLPGQLLQYTPHCRAGRCKAGQSLPVRMANCNPHPSPSCAAPFPRRGSGRAPPAGCSRCQSLQHSTAQQWHTSAIHLSKPGWWQQRDAGRAGTGWSALVLCLTVGLRLGCAKQNFQNFSGHPSLQLQMRAPPVRSSAAGAHPDPMSRSVCASHFGHTRTAPHATQQ